MALNSGLISAVFLLLISVVNAALTVSSRILVLAPDDATAKSAATGLRGYGIPYQTAIITAKSGSLPALSTSPTVGNFGGILATSDSILTSSVLDAIHTYQATFGVRFVLWGAAPSGNYGTKYAIAGTGCCDSTEQLISFTDISAFPTAGLRVGAGVSSQNIWHYPATITNSSLATQIASFAAAGSFTTATTAAVINNFGNREQMVWFIPFELDWSEASNYLEHAGIHWITRGLYLGIRRLQLNTQIDDMHLATAIYSPSATFRLRAADMDAHKAWTSTINAKMNPGSTFFVEIGHNGNGNIGTAYDANSKTCGSDAIAYVSQPYTSNDEWIKPLGTGSDCWPTKPTSFVWSTDCIALDSLEQWFANSANLNTFAHVSHTFTHESLDNATYSDANKEITFNQAWLNKSGIASATMFSPKSLIPPAITGLHNGDVIKAWADNGITAAVGDNTRAALLNTDNEYWPLITTTAANGYAGFPVIPRWATNIYYNCDTTSCISAQYTDKYFAEATTATSFNTILTVEQSTNVLHLLALRQDPFMFHQANLRQTDVPSTTLLDGTSQKLSLLQIWVETVVGELVRLTTWPIITRKFDDLVVDFMNRKTRDACNPDMRYNFDSNGSSIVSVTVSASGTGCAAEIPVTFPGPVTNQGAARKEQVGSDPLTLWIKWAGTSQTFTLTTPISVL